MRRALAALLGCMVSFSPAANAGERPLPALKAIAQADTTAVHPDSVFYINLSVQNLTDAPQVIQIPAMGWDRVWKSSQGALTWEPWGYDDPASQPVEIAPRGTYVFPKPLPVYIKPSYRRASISFRLGLKARGMKLLWSDPITLEVIPKGND